jgi:SAM-dependent methyltransferase
LLPKYVSLVVANGLLSYVLIQLIHSRTGLSAIGSKVIAEGLLFLANFAIQRDFVFTRRQALPAATDWDSYYKSIPFTAKLTRRYTAAVLLKAIRSYSKPMEGSPGLSIVEIGGANSCFLDAMLREIDCSSYDVIDTNQHGLSLLAERLEYAEGRVRLHNQSVLGLSLDVEADLVFSVGLVEHFDPRETREAVLAHFNLLRPGGTAIITFPTPTLLYRVTRRLIEMLHMWKFPDERPLAAQEILATLQGHADVLCEKTLWPLFLTQKLIVAKKCVASPAHILKRFSSSLV